MIYRHSAVQYKATTRKIYTQVPSYYGGDGTEEQEETWRGRGSEREKEEEEGRRDKIKRALVLAL